MNVLYLREFLVFERHMNFTAAAKELFISQPTLSNHIAALETELEAELVNHGNPPSLTHVGRVLAHEAPRLIACHDDVLEKCRVAATSGGTVVVARNHGTQSCSDSNFGILISEFLAAHPEAFVQDSAWDDYGAYETLASGKADCVMVDQMPPSTDVERGVKFVRIPNRVGGTLLLWVDKSHPLAENESVTWEDITCIKTPVSINQRVIETALQGLCKRHGVELQLRSTPESGWSYLSSFEPDEMLLLDTGYKEAEFMRAFPQRVFLPVVGEGSEHASYLGYLPSNGNRALASLVEFTENQTERSVS